MSLTEEGQLVLVVLGLVGIRLPFFPNIPCNITLTGRIVDKRQHFKHQNRLQHHFSPNIEADTSSFHGHYVYCRVQWTTGVVVI